MKPLHPLAQPAYEALAFARVIPDGDPMPLVRDRVPSVLMVDEDNDGNPDLFLYDVNLDGQPDIYHRASNRETWVDVVPDDFAPTVTHYTGHPSEVSLRVTFRFRAVAGRLVVNGVPSVSCVESHGMLSLGVLWGPDRERDNEVAAARAFLVMNGFHGCMERA